MAELGPRPYAANTIEHIGEKTGNHLAQRWAAQVTFGENVTGTCQRKKKIPGRMLMTLCSQEGLERGKNKKKRKTKSALALNSKMRSKP